MGMFDVSFDGLKQTVKDWGKDPLNELASAATNYLSLGTLQYNHGKFEEGHNIHAISETYGEISGANRARKASYAAADEVRAAQALAAKDEANRQLQLYRSDMNASRTAEATRNTAMIRGTSGTRSGMTNSNSLGGVGEDVLGV